MIQKIEKKNGWKIYHVYFSDITDLYNYLKSNPKVNKKVFTFQSSLKKEPFYGEPLENAIEYLLGGYTKNLDNFLIMLGDLNKSCGEENEVRSLKRGFYGGVPLSPLVAAGVPDCMLRYERDTAPKNVNIYFNFSYAASHDTSQIFNRGLATLYLIQALQDKGYIINFKAFELSSWGTEIINIVVDLKKPEDMFLNVEKCYFPMVGKEFLRRVLFRVLESVPVMNDDWSSSYGQVASNNIIKTIYHLKDNDMIIQQPISMNIRGNNIYEDTIALIQKLGIENEFDIQKIKKMKKSKSN